MDTASVLGIISLSITGLGILVSISYYGGVIVTKLTSLIVNSEAHTKKIEKIENLILGHEMAISQLKLELMELKNK